DRESFRHLEKAQLASSLEVLLQAASHHRNPAFELRRHSDQVLDAVDVRCEVRHNDPARRLGEDALERSVEGALRARTSLALRVGRVTEQEQDPGVAQPAEPIHVGWMAVRRRRIELEVARIDHAAHRRLDGESDSVRYRVTYRDRLDPDRPDLDRLTHPHLAQVALTQHAVLLPLRLAEAKSRSSAVNRPVVLPERVAQPSAAVPLT